ncbi:periodic tryptophan protein 2 homolog, partial [Pyxicephalus adspersus]|uniref:periodic tryptophan protein 2 homolog n=1 Tax=Pyxicephalus adspersus TaxID=30357 RepID=UPI003B597C27
MTAILLESKPATGSLVPSCPGAPPFSVPSCPGAPPSLCPHAPGAPPSLCPHAPGAPPSLCPHAPGAPPFSVPSCPRRSPLSVPSCPRCSCLCRKFVVCRGSLALMYFAPGKSREFNAFALDKTFYGPYDETTCIDWTDDSRCFAVGSKDMSTWVFGAERWQNLIYYSLGGHKDAIVSCFFLEGSLDLYTVSADAALCMWQCDTELSQLLPRAPKKKTPETEDNMGEEKGEEIRGSANPSAEEKVGRVRYSRTTRHYFNKEADFTALTAAAFHKKLHLLVTGFSSGTFHIHELPEINLIHSLRLQEFLDRRKMTEFGSLALIDEGAGDEDGVALSLPGVRKGDMSSRRFKPEIRVTSLRFSPTGRSWAATSTEGLLIFSLDSSSVFDPFHLDEEVTAGSVHRALRAAQWTRALVMAMRLNEERLLQETLESVPCTDIKVLCSSLPDLYAERLLAILASQIERSRHLQFYLIWAHELLMQHGQKIKNRSVALLPAIHSLSKSIQSHFNDISKLCDWNRYNMKFAVCLSRQRGVKRSVEDGEESEEGDTEDGEESE